MASNDSISNWRDHNYLRYLQYNKNVLVEAGEGALTTTSRLVLDFQKNSEEPLIEVHSDLVKHLKPHQVQGELPSKYLPGYALCFTNKKGVGI